MLKQLQNIYFLQVLACIKTKFEFLDQLLCLNSPRVNEFKKLSSCIIRTSEEESNSSDWQTRQTLGLIDSSNTIQTERHQAGRQPPIHVKPRNSKSKLNLSLTEKKTLNGHLRQTDQTLPFTEEFLAFWNIFHQHFYGLSVRTHTYMITHLRFSFIFWAVSHLTFCSAWLFVCCLFCYVMMFSLFRACPVNQSCLSRHIMMNLRWAQSLIPKYVVQTVLVEAVLYLIELMQRIAVQ